MNMAIASNITADDRAARYARCVKADRKGEWQIDRDLMQGRSLDFSRKFLPVGLSLLDRVDFLNSWRVLVAAGIARDLHAA